MSQRSKPITLILAALLSALFLTAVPAQANVIPAAPGINKSHWMYFGWMGEPAKQKTLAFPGGGIAPGRKRNIEYFLSSGSDTYYPNDKAVNMRGSLTWSLAEGYLPSPISSWPAGSTQVKVQHFANSINGSTAVYSRVTVANRAASAVAMRLNITAPPAAELPLSGAPTASDNESMYYDLSIPAGQSVSKDFVTLAVGPASSGDLLAAGTFDANYAAMAKFWNDKLSKIALPTSLPDPQLVAMYKATQINVWESVEVDGNGHWQQYTSGGNQAGLTNYDAVNDNDEIDIVLQHIKVGSFDSAARIMSSAAFESIPRTWRERIDYLQVALKFTEVYDLYQRLANDPAFFTDARKELLKWAAHNMTTYLVNNPADPHHGLMQKSSDFDNGSDYLINDEFAAIYGLTAYQNLANSFATTDPAWTAEATWAKGVANGINTTLNNYLKNHTFPRMGGNYYQACLDWCAKSATYNGNWLGTTWLMSSLPWDGFLAGNTLGGAWRDAFDASNYAAFTARDFQEPTIPPYSWGAWWTGAGAYGNTFNAGGGAQLLASSDVNLRTEAVRNLEWLLANQSAPMQWGESFHNGSWTKPSADLNAYGLASTGKAILESSVSVAADGTAIIGRGLPNSWITSGKPTSWTRIPVGRGTTLDFTITPQPGNRVQLTLKGNAKTPVKFELPLFVNNITSASTGTVDNAKGSVTLPAGTASATITVRSTEEPPLVVNTSTAGSIDVGQFDGEQVVGQSFFANSSPTLNAVQINLRKAGGNRQSDVTVSLQTMANGLPTGIQLAVATIPARSIGRGFTPITVPLKYDRLIPGRNYAIVVGQLHTSTDSYYQWATTGRGGPLGMASHNPNGWASRNSELGNAWLTLDVQGSLAMSPDLSTSGTANYYFGQPGDQVSRGQLFLATGMTTLRSIRVKVKRVMTTEQSAMTASLYATENGKPTGNPLATTTVPASRIGTLDTIVDVPLKYTGLVPGTMYAIVLGQQTPSGSYYGWTTSGSNGMFGFGKIQPDGSWRDESNLGDAWLQVSGDLRSNG